MRPLRYAINVSVDGCCHHEAGLPPDAESMAFWAGELDRADALVFGRVTYEMMRSAWRRPDGGEWPAWMQPWQVPFAEVIDAAPKHVVSSTLPAADWNGEVLRGDVARGVENLKQQPGKGLFLGGVTLPAALADLGLIDEYLFIVHPVVAGHGPYLLGGLREQLGLTPVERRELRSGAVAMRYEPSGS